MKYLGVSTVSATRSMPLKNGSLLHIQDSYKELFREVMKPIIGNDYNSTKTYILSGCVNTGTGGAYVISAGYVFVAFSGEIFRVPASSFTPAVGETAVLIPAVTNINGVNYDPVQFTDGSSVNVHLENIINVSSAVAGSGASDYADLIRINEHEHLQLTLQSGYTTGTLANGVFATRNAIQQITIECSVQVTGSPSIGSQICALLPTNYRPLHTVRVPCVVDPTGAGTNLSGYAIIDTAGRISAVINATNFTNNDTIYFNASYYII